MGRFCVLSKPNSPAKLPISTANGLGGEVVTSAYTKNKKLKKKQTFFDRRQQMLIYTSYI